MQTSTATAGWTSSSPAISHPVSSDYNRKWSDPSQLLINQGPDADWTFVNEWQERGLPFNEGDVDGANRRH